MSFKGDNCILCNTPISENNFICELNHKPPNETNFNIPKEKYVRTIYQCSICGVYLNKHNILPDNLYESGYNQATYQNQILKNYKKIQSLDHSKSDNKHRVKRILQFLKNKSIDISNSSILDVGSGLCVFLGELKQYGPYTACIDPDPISTIHASKNIRINESHTGTLDNFKSKIKYDLITFNKVLEHLDCPVEILIKAKKFLSKKGYFYIELPDGDNALQNGHLIHREEFYIEHITVFNEKSIRALAEKAGLFCDVIKTIHEPSDKYTVYAFMKKT